MGAPESAYVKGRPMNTLTFSETDSYEGVTVTDHANSKILELHTESTPRTTPTETDHFYFPVDNAVSVTTNHLSIPRSAGVTVRNQEGDTLSRPEQSNQSHFHEQDYLIELDFGMKLYLLINSKFTYESDYNQTELTFPNSTDVKIGVRSFHEQPTSTITIPPSAEGVAEALPYLAANIKEFTPERSFPTLRDHPPSIEIGGELDIPDSLNKPDTDITITTPAELETLYTLAPLVYYLGADIEISALATIQTPTKTHNLEAGDSLANTVTETLQQCFFFDCLTRNGGYYSVTLTEENALEQELPFSPHDLYHNSVATQLNTYLSVPYETIEPYIPTWPIAAHVESIPSTATILPQVLHELGFIVPTDGTDINVGKAVARRISSSPRLKRSPMMNSFGARFDADGFIELTETPAVEDVWFGDGVPINGTEASLSSYATSSESPSSTEVDVQIVCNDENLNEELELSASAYNKSNSLVTVDVFSNITVDELRAHLKSDCDFFHYIGHIDDDGFRCTDGHLDANSIDTVGITTFLLNGCQSYPQGRSLINSGALGGVVTLANVTNESAIQAGTTLARLLAIGYPLRVSYHLVRDGIPAAYSYSLLGYGGVEITQSQSADPDVCEVQDEFKSHYRVRFNSYTSDYMKIGSFTADFLNDETEYHLVGSKSDVMTVEKADFQEYLDAYDKPIKDGRELYLNDDVEELDH